MRGRNKHKSKKKRGNVKGILLLSYHWKCSTVSQPLVSNVSHNVYLGLLPADVNLDGGGIKRRFSFLTDQEFPNRALYEYILLIYSSTVIYSLYCNLKS